MTTDYGQVYPVWPGPSGSMDKFHLDHGSNVTQDQMRHEMALLAVQSQNASRYNIHDSVSIAYGSQNDSNLYQGQNMNSNLDMTQMPRAQYSSNTAYGDCGTMQLQQFSQQDDHKMAASNSNSLSAMSRGYSTSSNAESFVSPLNSTSLDNDSMPHLPIGQDSQIAALALTGLSTMPQQQSLSGSKSGCKDPCRGPCPSEDVMMCETEHGQPLEDCDEGNCAGTYCDDDCDESDCHFPSSCLPCEWDQCNFFVADNPTLYQHLVNNHIAMQDGNDMSMDEFQRQCSNQGILDPLHCLLPGCEHIFPDYGMLQSHFMEVHNMSLSQCRWRDCYQTLPGPTALQSHVSSQHLGFDIQALGDFDPLPGLSSQPQDPSHLSEPETSSSYDVGETYSTDGTPGLANPKQTEDVKGENPLPICTPISDKSQSAQVEEIGKCKWILDDGEICCKTFENGKQLQEHIESSHLSLAKGHKNNNKEFVCLWHGCKRMKEKSKPPWTKSQQIKEHLRTHTKCMLTRFHRRVLLMYPGNAVKCAQCGKMCNDKKQLDQHMLIHTKERPHRCEICHKTFGHPATLSKWLALYRAFSSHLTAWLTTGVEAHMHKHKEAWPYQCEKCPHRDTDRANFKRHLAIHEDAGFKCDYCNHTAKKRFNIRRHQANCKHRPKDSTD